MKIYKKIIFTLLVALLPFLATCTSLTPDATLYLDLMRQYAQERLDQMPGIALRDIAADYQDYILGPNPFFLLLFGGARELEIPLSPMKVIILQIPVSPSLSPHRILLFSGILPVWSGPMQT